MPTERISARILKEITMTYAINKKIGRLFRSVAAAAAVFAVMGLSGVVSAQAAEPERGLITAGDFQSALNGAFGWELDRLDGDTLCEGFLTAGTAAESESDWFVISERAAGAEDDYAAYAETAAEILGSRLDDPSGYYLTELARTAVALGLCGEDNAPDLSGLELGEAGDNEVIWVAIAQKLNGYDYSSAELELFERQSEDGGFGLAETDADITAMALHALPKGCEQAEAAIGYLKKYYAENSGEMSCETAAQIIMGLCAQGVNPSQSADFTDENGVRPIDVLMSKRVGGGFTHLDEDEPNAMATMQAAAALSALGYYSETGRSVFEPGFEPADVYSCENPIGETFDEYDLGLLNGIKEPSASDFERLKALRERADIYGTDNETYGILDGKLAESESICKQIEELNGEIRDGFYPADSVGLSRLGRLRGLNEKISGFSEEDRTLILSADELAERETLLSKRKAVLIIAVCGGSAAAVTAVAVIIYIKRKNKA